MASYKTAFDVYKESKNLPNHLRPNNIRRKDVGSRAEYNVYWSLQKRSACEIIPQYTIGKYRVDFLLRRPDAIIAIEIDGKKWHDEERDSYRDKYIIGNSDITDIVRFTGTDATFTPTLCTKFLYDNYAILFKNNRGGWRESVNHYISYKLRHEGIVNVIYEDKISAFGYNVNILNLDYLLPEDQEKYMLCNDGVPEYNKMDIGNFTRERNTNIKIMNDE